tara:strand:- start:1075 stop:1329 length:255 start_codon:yes stop_codon:yes gene_type:complete
MASVKSIKKAIAELERKVSSVETINLIIAKTKDDEEEKIAKCQNVNGTLLTYVLPLYSFSETKEFKQSSTKTPAQHMSDLGLLI